MERLRHDPHDVVEEAILGRETGQLAILPRHSLVVEVLGLEMRWTLGGVIRYLVTYAISIMRRRGRPRHPDILTPREWEVLALLREGLSNPEIASRLGIGREGVKSHVSEILGKLDVENRYEAARWVATDGSWWARVPLVAPMAIFLRRALPGSPATGFNVLAGAALAVAIGTLGVFAFLLLQTDGSDAPVGTEQGGSPTLQLRTGPISEDEFRIQVRQSALVQSPSFDIACDFFRPTANSIPAPEILEVFQRINPFASRTPIAEPVLDDEIRAVEIIGEECESLT